MSFNLETHLLRQMAFSRTTFGPGERRGMVCDHIRKELVEVEACDTEESAAKEWTDVAILALDGLTRAIRASGIAETDADAAMIACAMIAMKQGQNELRRWPDWRTADPTKAIEHDRRAEGGAA